MNAHVSKSQTSFLTLLKFRSYLVDFVSKTLGSIKIKFAEILMQVTKNISNLFLALI